MYENQRHEAYVQQGDGTKTCVIEKTFRGYLNTNKAGDLYEQPV
jgi:hypothetical protein